LEFDCFVVNVDGADLKVNTYRAEIALRVSILGEPQEETRLNLKALSSSGVTVAWDAHLSYSRITNEEEFEEIIILVRHFGLEVLVVVVVVKEAEGARSQMSVNPLQVHC
jgi:hypothetical protein